MPTITKYSGTSEITNRLGGPFQKAVFAAAIKSLQQKGNPLRFNNFATNLRELGRMMLDDLAPEKSIKASTWYKPEFNEKKQEIITRAQRVKYAIQAGLPDDFVKKTLKIDVTPTIRKYTKLIKHLSDFTHVTEKVFGIKRSVEDQYVQDALTTFILVFQTIDDCRSRVIRRIENRAQRALNFELIATSIDELDEIATHHIVHGGDIDDLELKSMDDSTIIFDLEGSVDCQLQYGSDGDYERGDGLRREASYPLTCELVADIMTPLDLEVRQLRVDNSSFYGQPEP